MRKLLPLLLLLLAACGVNGAPPAPTLTPRAAATATLSAPLIPLAEDEVPRVTVAEAKAALEGGLALILDVRSAEAFAEKHIAGAIHLRLAEIELNPANIQLDKQQWIITYCT